MILTCQGFTCIPAIYMDMAHFAEIRSAVPPDYFLSHPAQKNSATLHFRAVALKNV